MVASPQWLFPLFQLLVSFALVYRKVCKHIGHPTDKRIQGLGQCLWSFSNVLQCPSPGRSAEYPDFMDRLTLLVPFGR